MGRIRLSILVVLFYDVLPVATRRRDLMFISTSKELG
jgi:hypothetical protein